MNNYEAFYEFVKNELNNANAATQVNDKIEHIKSALKLMEIITKE